MNIFLPRQQEISIRNPEELLFARPARFTTESVAKRFEIYELTMDSTYHNPEKLYNRKETDITILQHKYNKCYY